jgi:hypothetical protein
MSVVVHIVDSSILTDAEGFTSRSSRTSGDVVIQIGAACNGITQAISDARRATSSGDINALIFYGHGASGVQGVSMGKDGGGIKEQAAITAETLDDPGFSSQLRALAKNFSSDGVIVLHGCNVAEGEAGKSLLQKLSKITGVPVKGSDWYQIVGRSDLSGNILSASPSGTIQEDTRTGLKNLGGLPAGESLLLLGVEFGDRLLRRFGLK